MSNTHHVCFSGSLACSGPNPCKTCFDLVNHHVIAFAMQHAGMTLEQGRVLFQWIEEGWKRLHLQMMQDPNIAQRALDTSRVRIEPLPAPMTAPFAAPPMAPAGSPMAPMTFPMTPLPSNAPVPAPAPAQAIIAPQVPSFDPSALGEMSPFDPRLIMLLAPMIQAAMQQQMQQAAEEQEEQEEQEQEQEQEEVQALPALGFQPAAPPAIISFPEPVAHAEVMTAPAIADVPSQKPVAALQRSNGNGVAVTRSELNARTEMTVEDIMSLGSPLVDTSASADAVEPAEPALNGASTT